MDRLEGFNVHIGGHLGEPHAFGQKVRGVRLRADELVSFAERMLRMYRREAQFLLEEGATPSEVDRALEQWGMAMGPFKTQDLAGFDIAMASRAVFDRLEPPGQRHPRVFDELYARGRRPDPAHPSFLNFGALRIGADGLLTIEIRDAEGAIPSDARGRAGSLVLAPVR